MIVTRTSDMTSRQNRRAGIGNIRVPGPVLPLEMVGRVNVAGGISMGRSVRIVELSEALEQRSYTQSLAGCRLALSVRVTFVILTILGGTSLGHAESDAGEAAKRILHFPQDRSLGRILVQDTNVKRRIRTFHYWVDGGDWHSLGQAQGDVVVSAGKRARLVMDEITGRRLSALAQLEPNDLYWLKLPGSAGDSCMDYVTKLAGLRVLELDGSITDRGMRNITRLKSLERLYLSGRIGNAGLEQVARLPSLTGLYAGQTRITDEGLSLLAELTNLEELNVGGQYIRDAGLEHLAKLPSLQYLMLSGQNFSDAALAHIRNIPSLRILSLAGQLITDAGVRHLSGHTGLQSLSLYETRVTNRGLAYLKSLPSLKKLDIGKRGPQEQITDAGMTHIAQIDSLEYLDLPSFGITDKGLAEVARLRNLKHLWVSGRSNSPLTDDSLKHISELQSLEFLLVSGTGFTNAGLDYLAMLTNLIKLHLTADSITDEGLAKLRALKSLEDLHLRCENVSISGLSHLNALTNISRLALRDIRQDNSDLDISALSKLSDLSITLNATRQEEKLFYDAVRDEDLACLKKLKKLRRLVIGYAKHSTITDEGIANLSNLTQLEELTIGSPRLTDKSLSYISNSRQLKILRLTGNFTDNGLRHLEELEALHYLRMVTSNKFTYKARRRLLDSLPNLDRRYFVVERDGEIANR
jgi:Leucine-rich repeat (LRR) protein